MAARPFAPARNRIALIGFALALACASEPTPDVDAGFFDAGTKDAGGSDAGAIDAGAMADSGQQDVGVGPQPGFGVISGSCDRLDDELTSPDPATFDNRFDFGVDPYDDADLAALTEGGREIIRDGNAGGNSLLSEVFAYELLARCEGAELLKTETEIVYVDAMGRITDLLVEIEGIKMGVSVTRAVGFPRDAPYTEMQARDLLEDKLSDILESSANVAVEDRWAKQILHVIAYAEGHRDALMTVYPNIDGAIRADTILMVTVTDGDDAFLY